MLLILNIVICQIITIHYQFLNLRKKSEIKRKYIIVANIRYKLKIVTIPNQCLVLNEIGISLGVKKKIQKELQHLCKGIISTNAPNLVLNQCDMAHKKHCVNLKTFSPHIFIMIFFSHLVS